MFRRTASVLLLASTMTLGGYAVMPSVVDAQPAGIGPESSLAVCNAAASNGWNESAKAKQLCYAKYGGPGGKPIAALYWGMSSQIHRCFVAAGWVTLGGILAGFGQEAETWAELANGTIRGSLLACAANAGLRL